MSQNVIKAEPVEAVISERFRKEDGSAEVWRFGAITGAEDEELRREASVRRAAADGLGAYVTETDYNKYVGLLAARCVLYPDLTNVELQNSYKVYSPDALLKTMLTAGEFAEAAAVAQRASGFDMTEAVEAVKK